MKKACTIFTILISAISGASFAQYNLQGDGFEIGENCYQLTSATTNQVSTIWYEEQVNLTVPFELQFKMNFGSNNGTNGETSGADGMMFVLQNESPTAVGVMGEGIGYGNLDPSLGIEFDTYYNGNLNDMYPDHIAIHRDGNTNHSSPNALAGPVQADPDDIDIEDGEDHAISITWDPFSQEIRVYFDCQFRLSTSIDLVNSIFGGETNVWWGFSASTGGSYNVHTVCLYENVSPSGDIAICPGFTTQLIAGGDINSEYSWSPIDYLDDPTVYNPVASPPSSQVYTVTYTDFCGQLQSNSIQVTVEPIEVQIFSDETTITCDVSEIDLTAYTNYQNTDVTWSTLEGDGELDVLNDFNASANEGGIYMISVVSEDGNCSAEDVLEVIVDTTSYTAETGPTGIINCYNPTYILDASSNGDDAQFSWSTQDGDFLGGSLVPNATVIAEGTYTLTVTNPSNGCVSSNSLFIEDDFTWPVITLGEPDGIISCITPTVQIQGTTIEPEGYTNNIEWTWAEGGLIDPWSIEPSTPIPGNYALTVTFEENGCSTSTMDSVTVEQDEFAFISIESLTVPNIITPNGDVYNNKLIPMFSDPELSSINPLDVVDYWKLIVRDRWGLLVYENNGAPYAWDGRNLNGEFVHSGTYLIEVDYQSTCGEIQNGSHMGILKIISD